MGAKPAKLPKHIAIIMDGNGRWAQSQGLPRLAGHHEGTKRVREISRACRELGIRHLTLYAFSSENWRRPEDEVAGLMDLLRVFLEENRQELVDTETRLVPVGDLSKIPAATMAEVERTVEATRHFTKYTLNIALSYGGRDEILQAVRSLAADVKDGLLNVDDIDEERFSSRLYTKGQPDPDLMIRTSGEQRISNYLLWQLAYAEFLFVPEPWPEFTVDRLMVALDQFGNRERRFGMTGEQVKAQ